MPDGHIRISPHPETVELTTGSAQPICLSTVSLGSCKGSSLSVNDGKTRFNNMVIYFYNVAF